jgi:hypothetical protein
MPHGPHITGVATSVQIIRDGMKIPSNEDLGLNVVQAE